MVATNHGVEPDMNEEGRPFPASLCHRCAAPPRYVRGARSVFILCPLVPERYPRQPVLECQYYRPLGSSRAGSRSPEGNGPST